MSNNKIVGKNKVRKIILLVVVILVVHTKERSGEMIKMERKKSGNGSGIAKFDVVWHILYNKGCGWNKTHTAGLHGITKPIHNCFHPNYLPPILVVILLRSIVLI